VIASLVFIDVNVFMYAAGAPHPYKAPFCRDILKYPLTILPVVENDFRLAIDLFQVHQATGLKPRDAIHAATMQNNGITRLISADADFNRLSSVIRVDPLAY
jgi:predicted nucleic acid-binding protein